MGTQPPIALPELHRSRGLTKLIPSSAITTPLSSRIPSCILQARRQRDIPQRMFENGQQKTGFLSLSYEIRIRVYRQVFVTEAPISHHETTVLGHPASCTPVVSCMRKVDTSSMVRMLSTLKGLLNDLVTFRKGLAGGGVQGCPSIP